MARDLFVWESSNASDLDDFIWGGTLRADRDLLNQLRTRPLPDGSDLDAALVLAEQVLRDFKAFGTGGGEQLDPEDMTLAVRALRATLARLDITIALPFRGYGTFWEYWKRAGAEGSYQARRDILSGIFDPVIDELIRRQDHPGPLPGLATVALSALSDASAIRDHLDRLSLHIDRDPRLVVSVAKDLVESTAKLVLRHRGLTFGDDDRVEQLAHRAQEALYLHPKQVTATEGEDGKALQTLLGALLSLTKGVAELRNKVGLGHGRESVPTWVRPRHARLAVGAATTWCNLPHSAGEADAGDLTIEGCPGAASSGNRGTLGCV